MAVKYERFFIVQPAKDGGFFTPKILLAAFRRRCGKGYKTCFLPLTLAVTAIFYIIKTSWRLRLTVINQESQYFSLYRLHGGFFCPEMVPVAGEALFACHDEET
ncbi:hypothetical protein [Pantoea anthophila]|uniref:hypothetical protein n=1 Tax=Pantoea anthophila TaxID=470931 RepID=UPI00301DD34A